MTLTTAIIYWVLVGVFSGMLHVSIMMLWTGKAWPLNFKVSPILGTAVHIIGMTGLLIFGQQDLLKKTLALLFP